MESPMKRTEEALEILSKHHPEPMTAREVYDESNLFEGVAESCWAINTLVKSGKVRPVGEKPQAKGPKRISYGLADKGAKNAPKAPAPMTQEPEPPAKTVTTAPAREERILTPFVKPAPVPATINAAEPVITPKASEIGLAAADAALDLSIDEHGWLRLGPALLTPAQTSQLGRFLSNVRGVWENFAA